MVRNRANGRNLCHAATIYLNRPCVLSARFWRKSCCSRINEHFVQHSKNAGSLNKILWRISIMNIEKCKQFLALIICTNFVLFGCSYSRDSSGSSLKSSDPQPLEKKSGRHPFCGVEALTKIEHPSCQVKDYRENRTSACGIERYTEKPSLSCPGSVSHDVQTMQSWGGCQKPAPKPSCPGGYYPVQEWKETEWCMKYPGTIRESLTEEVKRWAVRCQRDEVLNT